MNNEKCTECKGTGKIELLTSSKTCTACNGTGKIELLTSSKTCTACKGTGEWVGQVYKITTDMADGWCIDHAEAKPYTWEFLKEVVKALEEREAVFGDLEWHC